MVMEVESALNQKAADEPLQIQYKTALNVLRHIEAERCRVSVEHEKAFDRGDAAEMFRLQQERQQLELNWYTQKARVLGLTIDCKKQEKKDLQSQLAFLTNLQEERAREAKRLADEAQAALDLHGQVTFDKQRVEMRLENLRDEVAESYGEMQSLRSEYNFAGGRTRC